MNHVRSLLLPGRLFVLVFLVSLAQLLTERNTRADTVQTTTDKWWLNASEPLESLSDPDLHSANFDDIPVYEKFGVHPEEWRFIALFRSNWGDTARIYKYALPGQFTVVVGYPGWGQKQAGWISPEQLFRVYYRGEVSIHVQFGAVSLRKGFVADRLSAVTGQIILVNRYQGQTASLDDFTTGLSVRFQPEPSTIPTQQDSNSSYWLTDFCQQWLNDTASGQQVLCNARAWQLDDRLEVACFEDGHWQTLLEQEMESPVGRVCIQGNDLFAVQQLENKVIRYQLTPSEQKAQKVQVFEFNGDTSRHNGFVGISGITMTPDQGKLAISLYYSGKVLIFHRENGEFVQQQEVWQVQDSKHQNYQLDYPCKIRFLDNHHMIMEASIGGMRTVVLLRDDINYPPVFPKGGFVIRAPARLNPTDTVGTLEGIDPENAPLRVTFDPRHNSSYALAWDEASQELVTKLGWDYEQNGLFWAFNLTVDDGIHPPVTGEVHIVISGSSPPGTPESPGSLPKELAYIALIVPVMVVPILGYCAYRLGGYHGSQFKNRK